MTAVDRRADEEVLIEAGRGLRHYWLDLWRYRELFCVPGLARPGGPLQADGHRRRVGLLRPLLIMIVFTLVFGSLAGLSRRHAGRRAVRDRGLRGAAPMAVLRRRARPTAAQSLVDNANMIGKVYFPRLAMPASAR